MHATNVGGGVLGLKSMARVEDSPNGINSHVSVTKAGLQLGVHWLHQVYLPET